MLNTLTSMLRLKCSNNMLLQSEQVHSSQAQSLLWSLPCYRHHNKSSLDECSAQLAMTYILNGGGKKKKMLLDKILYIRFVWLYLYKKKTSIDIFVIDKSANCLSCYRDDSKFQISKLNASKHSVYILTYSYYIFSFFSLFFIYMQYF